jgi:sortase A
LGTISIDKIKVKSIIVEGVKPDNLRTGIGHMPGTALPGQPGNCVLTGRRSYTFGRFFNRLDELEIGDAIVLSDKEADYTYIVFERSEVLPTDLSILESNDGESIATLITCTPIYSKPQASYQSPFRRDIAQGTMKASLDSLKNHRSFL